MSFKQHKTETALDREEMKGIPTEAADKDDGYYDFTEGQWLRSSNFGLCEFIVYEVGQDKDGNTVSRKYLRFNNEHLTKGLMFSNDAAHALAEPKAEEWWEIKPCPDHSAKHSPWKVNGDFGGPSWSDHYMECLGCCLVPVNYGNGPEHKEKSDG